MKIKILLLFTFIVTLIVGCNSDDEYTYYPKPISGQRVFLPKKAYKTYQSHCNYSFDIPAYSTVIIDSTTCNNNINLGSFNAELYLTYIKVDTNLMSNIEYSRKLAYDHSIKADGIEEKVILNPKHKTYGVQYKIVGNAASNYQFYVTDSTSNFLRGALYFNTKPNYDSLKPFLTYIMDDCEHMLNTLNWE